MKTRIQVRLEDYIKYTQTHLTDKLDEGLYIYSQGSFPPKFIRENLNINEELFEGIPTNYQIIEENSEYFLIKFSSKSNNYYRMDLYKERENDIWHIGFSEWKMSVNEPDKYESLTNKGESIDVISRMIWILKNLNLDGELCIGATGDSRKDRIYQYIMKYVSGWEKRKTDEYQLGWGLYFRV
jgi:hypothetical protein